MHLREAQWQALLRLGDATQLPRMHAKFTLSPRWQLEQLPIVVLDISRMPSMHIQNVLKVIARFSATAPYGGYTQGNLYLLYAAGLVYDDEIRVYWAFERLVHRVNRYGPSTASNIRLVPGWVIAIARHYAPIDCNTWHLLLRLRWIYVLFGQTFVTHAGLLSACDFALHGKSDIGIFALCAALLERASGTDMSQYGCDLEIASAMIGHKVVSDEDAACVISRAQLFLACPGCLPISTARQPAGSMNAMSLPDPGSTAVPTQALQS